MNHLARVDWSNIGAVTAIIVAVFGGYRWVHARIYAFARLTSRLEKVESVISEHIRPDIHEMKGDIKEIRKEIHDKFDAINVSVTELKALYEKK